MSLIFGVPRQSMGQRVMLEHAYIMFFQSLDNMFSQWFESKNCHTKQYSPRKTAVLGNTFEPIALGTRLHMCTACSTCWQQWRGNPWHHQRCFGSAGLAASSIAFDIHSAAMMAIKETLLVRLHWCLRNIAPCSTAALWFSLLCFTCGRKFKFHTMPLYKPYIFISPKVLHHEILVQHVLEISQPS